MSHLNALASAALVLVVGAMSAACSAAPDSVVLDREDEPQVSATATAATATTRAPLETATAAAATTRLPFAPESPEGLTCFTAHCSGVAGTLECRELCHEADAWCASGRCYVP